eukprot:CAMPEP_0206544620 /NCGR_PEP_ID=MMETSP0325_2-20121206/11641_1 /ASSEMBLY_ACC=CAM_ASM_000347 /TAXON_ID=2866 /ORGANISM="Crypthecodinium cohnii, Strain Seligo" /LENGTH=74 /DNA_ID=CAMNT_0054043433 /DNA_START=1162 /DNA_END=1383 /DNA_ORIENTATION=+
MGAPPSGATTLPATGTFGAGSNRGDLSRPNPALLSVCPLDVWEACLSWRGVSHASWAEGTTTPVEEALGNGRSA